MNQDATESLSFFVRSSMNKHKQHAFSLKPSLLLPNRSNQDLSGRSARSADKTWQLLRFRNPHGIWPSIEAFPELNFGNIIAE